MSFSLNYQPVDDHRRVHSFERIESLLIFIENRVKNVGIDEVVYLLHFAQEVFISDNPYMSIVVLSQMIAVESEEVDLGLFEFESYNDAYNFALDIKKLESSLVND